MFIMIKVIKLQGDLTYTSTETKALMQNKRTWLSALVDDLSCAAFTTACAVTLLFYTLKFATNGGVEPIVKPPIWIGYSVHVFNSFFAVLDIVFARQRSFGPRSHRMCLIFIFFYATWICICKCDFPATRVFILKLITMFSGYTYPIKAFFCMMKVSTFLDDLTDALVKSTSLPVKRLHEHHLQCCCRFVDIDLLTVSTRSVFIHMLCTRAWFDEVVYE